MQSRIGNVHPIIHPYGFVTECFRLPPGGNLKSSQDDKTHNLEEVLWIDGFANELLVNWAGGASLEAAGLLL